jgi:pimeloyl-ACP methyl ester carboxylesterase
MTTLDEMCAALMDTLAPRFRVTAFDRPGHGWSDPDPAHATPSAQAQKVHGAVESLGLERPVIVGHSLGGTVALAYGAQFPEEASGVVALSPLAYPVWGLGHLPAALRAIPGVGPALAHTLFALADPWRVRVLIDLIFSPQKPTARFREAFPTGLAGRPASVRADSVDVMRTTAALHQLAQSYPDYPLPVRVMVGERDRILKPRRQGERLARELRDAELTVLPGLRHMFHHFAATTVATAVDDVRARG